MQNEIVNYIKRHPFISFEGLQIALAACQGPRMIELVMTLAGLVDAGQIAVSANENTITKAPLACYDWIGPR